MICETSLAVVACYAGLDITIWLYVYSVEYLNLISAKGLLGDFDI